MSYTRLLYHLIIRTKRSQNTLSITHSEHLYRYIWGAIKNKNCHLYQINGTENHIHILFSLHPTIALSNFVRDIKAESSKMLKITEGFENFISWSEGYAALTVNLNDKENVIKYIKTQREHHTKVSFLDEYKMFVQTMGLTLDMRDWDK